MRSTGRCIHNDSKVHHHVTNTRRATAGARQHGHRHSPELAADAQLSHTQKCMHGRNMCVLGASKHMMHTSCLSSSGRVGLIGFSVAAARVGSTALLHPFVASGCSKCCDVGRARDPACDPAWSTPDCRSFLWPLCLRCCGRGAARATPSSESIVVRTASSNPRALLVSTPLGIAWTINKRVSTKPKMKTKMLSRVVASRTRVSARQSTNKPNKATTSSRMRLRGLRLHMVL
mmetsp:Transcript_44200/g.88326  ORF Transcript_44200/g.88326 Transcript_44200/m.88326 type:complete len:232 (-) Transcript_44200:1278-1973(-)